MWIFNKMYLLLHYRTAKAQWYSAGLRAGLSGVRVPAGAGNFSLHHRVQTGSGAHPASYPMDTRGCFSGGNVAGAWSWPLTSIYCRVQECMESYLHSPNSPSLHGGQLKKLLNYISRSCGFSLLHCVQSGSGANPASYPMSAKGILPSGKNGRSVKLTTHLHLVPRSRMRGAIPPLPQYAFTAWFSVEAQEQLYLALTIYAWGFNTQL
jgi:hypothetical protein